MANRILLIDVYTGQVNFLYDEIVKLDFDLNFDLALDRDFYKRIIKSHLKEIERLKKEISRLKELKDEYI